MFRAGVVNVRTVVDVAAIVIVETSVPHPSQGASCFSSILIAASLFVAMVKAVDVIDVVVAAVDA